MTLETQTPPEAPRGARRPSGKLILAAAVLFGLGGVGGFALGAHKAAPFLWHAMGPGKLTSAEMAEMVERKIDRALSHVDATSEQKAKVSAIAKAALADLDKLGFTPREGRAKFLALFRADKIEPDAIEALRAGQSAKWDAATKRIAQGLAEAAQVLTPDQRRELTEPWARRLSS
jgi:periplasmic protein CpxP/Spy